MTVRAGQYRLVGLSTDIKPTLATPDGKALAVADEFHEEDTGADFYWNGAAWVAKPPNTTVTTTETKQYTAPVTGERAGSASAVQLPNVPCKLVLIKAAYDNAGRVYIGIAGVTKADGTTDTTTGYQLQPGEETPWLPIDNLNRLYMICDNAGDDITYLALA